MHVAIVFHASPGKQIRRHAFPAQRKGCGVERARCSHAEVDHAVALFDRAVEDHRATTADAAHPRLQHAEREGGGDCGIDRIPALSEDCRSDFGSASMLRGDDATRAAHSGFGEAQ